MATIGSVIDTLISEMQPWFDGFKINNQPLPVVIGEGWPSLTVLEDTAKRQAVYISIYDTFVTPSTKFMPRRNVGVEKVDPGIKSTVSFNRLLPGDSQTISLDYATGNIAVKLNDAVSLVLRKGKTVGAVAKSVAGETLTTLASKLAQEINNASEVHSELTASASGPVVTVTNTSQKLLRIESYTGNIGKIYREVGRSEAHVRITCWCATPIQRRLIADILETKLFALRAKYGFQLPSGEHVRVQGASKYTMPDDNNVTSDIYRRDFEMEFEYPVTTYDLAWSVLVPAAVIS